MKILRARHDTEGLHLHARTAMPGWLGERLNVGWTIGVLHPLASRSRPRGASHLPDDPARERLGHAPLLIDADGEHHLLKSLTFELADLLDQRLGGAD